MAILVADIGGTSSRWAFLGDDGAERMHEGLPGYNAATGDPVALHHALETLVRNDPAMAGAAKLHAYGAGCGTAERRARLAKGLSALLPHTVIEVENDLCGAARGLLGRSSGLVLILGTGMNAGLYDGEQLHCPMPSLGYLLGDEGSGADLGRHLLNAALYGRLPLSTTQRLFPEGVPPLGTLIERIYRSASSARELASFAERLSTALDDVNVRELVHMRFAALAELLARFFPTASEVKATGSVAFGMSAPLAAALKERGLVLSDVRPTPLPGLLAYHRRPAP